ncbi:uncharacterized protein L3040_008553 [Drepanopeziza brunnea f. sp. 'multigermtubi']|uniref:uncharacterized protein n=1 Tax=Drepanopeziza brunnea f. sp. 'multigermtubi' TaxID=698441 RepID=UPI0023A5D0D5|nr:hypothetical protein L3040_008553 [Drepanopeziza brunnea f. sp. 'multigermtubi']
MGDYFRGGGGDEDDYERRPQRRRYEDPPATRIRKTFLALADSALKAPEEEVLALARDVAANLAEGEKGDAKGAGEVREVVVELCVQLVVEQPLKIPFVAAVVLVLNALVGGGGDGDAGGVSVAKEVLLKVCERLGGALLGGDWREVKLCSRFLGAVQGMLEGEGVWGVLQDFLGRAVDLQTGDCEETIGPELVKIILLTIPYVMASSATDNQEKAAAMVENTDIIASEPHVLQAMVDPYPGNGKEEASVPTGVLMLLQKQLQHEAATGWQLSCLPRPWKVKFEAGSENLLATAPKHALPVINMPEIVVNGPRPLFPDLYFSVYANQDVETVAPTTDIASCLIRDAIVDTINILDYNRNATAKFLIDIDCYFAPDTFVKRATPFDRLRDIEGDRSTWKPEDVAVDAVFSQLFQLPSPEHKLVYYHAVLTEACKIAPAAIAPSLGRAIRYLYRGVDSMDLELSYRFMDWFAHHLSNFGFTWKWTEWIDDVELPGLNPKKAFIEGALDKEIRLSFAQRIKGTLPAPYQALITKEKEMDTPDFKYALQDTPFSQEGQEILALLKKKSPEADIQPIIDRIHLQARSLALPDELVCSTDAYMTSICYIGSKSLSHVLSCIERCKDRLLALGPASPAARTQIIDSVMLYWKDQPGIGVNIVDKLLNYTILSPASVVDWALSNEGSRLGKAYVYEMVSSTIGKVTNRVRQVVQANRVPGLSPEAKALMSETVVREKASMKELFDLMERELVGWVQGSKAVGDGEGEMVKQWGERWLRVFRRKFAVEETWCLEFESRPEVRQDGFKAEGGVSAQNGAGAGADPEMAVDNDEEVS